MPALHAAAVVEGERGGRLHADQLDEEQLEETLLDERQLTRLRQR